ncbi:MAG: glycosyltransferase [Deltaproteobacteria bacterium]|nr:glycosyltransferase [Deltaproteobacteria bacterium]
MAPKIAHVITTFLDSNTSAWISALADHQQGCGWQVKLIVGRNSSPDLLAQKRRQGFRVTRIHSLRKYVHPFHDAAAFWELYRFFRRRRFDLVHTHLAKAGVLGRLAAKAAGLKNIVHSVYGASFAPTQPAIKYALYKNLEKLAGQATDRFAFVGRELHAAYQRAGVCNGRGSVVYYGKELAPFFKAAALSDQERLARRQAAGFAPDDLILGNVSRLVPWKGHHLALQVVHVLRQQFPHLKLIIVGDARTPAEQDYKEKLLKTAFSLGLQKHVVFTGWQRETAAYYALFDLYLLTSMPFEGVPGSVIEAVAAGVPVVGFDCYGLREIPGICARLVPPGRLDELISVTRQELLGRRGARDRRLLSALQLRQMEERFSLSRMVGRTFELYQPLLKNCASPNLKAR